jgi:putative ABC transport system permease protein
VNHLLMEGSRGNFSRGRRHRWRRALIIGEVALALVLLTGAGLFIRGLRQFAQRDPGWSVDGMLTGQLDLTSAKYKMPDQRRAFFQELQDGLSALPGVRSVAFSSRPPVLGSRMRRNISIERQPPAAAGQNFFAALEPVSISYFDTVGIRLEEGRLFTAADTVDKPAVVIINEAMARHCWPNESPIGKRISDADSAKPVWEEIVGVVADVRSPGDLGDSKPQPQTYHPLAQDPPSFANVEIRFRGAAESTAAALRRAVTGIDPEQSTYNIITAREFIRRQLNDMSLLGEMLAAFAGLGLSLAAIGIYGVISYTVAQRAGEIGLRLALGARRRDVLWLVLRQGLGQSLLGALVGFVGALGVARALASILPFPMGNNLVTLVGIAFALLAVALLACFIPAYRASRIDPMRALRCQ